MGEIHLQSIRQKQEMYIHGSRRPQRKNQMQRDISLEFAISVCLDPIIRFANEKDCIHRQQTQILKNVNMVVKQINTLKKQSQYVCISQ